MDLGLPAPAAYEHELLEYATRGLRSVPGGRLVGTAARKASVLSFVLEGYEPQEVGTALDREGNAVRAGHHCAQPVLRRFGLEATVRPSLAFCNTHQEVDAPPIRCTSICRCGAEWAASTRGRAPARFGEEDPYVGAHPGAGWFPSVLRDDAGSRPAAPGSSCRVMRRDQLEHAIRTACQIIGRPEVIVVGSQAILGTYGEDQSPADATMAFEELHGFSIDGSTGNLRAA
jgi:hypothetical protein